MVAVEEEAAEEVVEVEAEVVAGATCIMAAVGPATHCCGTTDDYVRPP